MKKKKKEKEKSHPVVSLEMEKKVTQEDRSPALGIVHTLRPLKTLCTPEKSPVAES